MNATLNGLVVVPQFDDTNNWPLVESLDKLTGNIREGA